MRASTVANQVNCPLLLESITSNTSADVVKMKKERGNAVFATVTPASLACDGKEYWNENWNEAASFLTSPPLRKGVSNALIEATASNIDVVSSNHRTFTSQQRAFGLKDFTKIPVGVNGIGERMMILWDKLVHSGKSTPEKFVALTSANAAKLFNMYPEKGRLEVGSQADLVIWDPNGCKTISVGDHHSKADYNVFNGTAVHGIPESVIISGRIVMDEGQLRVMQGYGKFIPLAPFGAHVYEKVRAKEAEMRSTTAVIRNESLPSNGNSIEAVPPPTPVKSNKAEKAASQQESNFDLKSHPNGNGDAPLQTKAATSVRVRAPPGGRSSGGFW